MHAHESFNVNEINKTKNLLIFFKRLYVNLQRNQEIFARNFGGNTSGNIVYIYYSLTSRHLVYLIITQYYITLYISLNVLGHRMAATLSTVIKWKRSLTVN